MTCKVAVTGVGALTPCGNDAKSTWTSLKEGKSGIDKITLFDTEAFSVHIGGEVRDFDAGPILDLPSREVQKLDRNVQFALVASKEAIEDAGLTSESYDPKKIGVVIGSGIGGLTTIEENMQKFLERGPRRISPFLVPKMMCNAAAGQVSIFNGFKGPNFCAVTACASANHSIGEALRLIRYGFADAIVAGGCEAAISVLGLGGFCSAKALSTRNDDPQKASRPFDKNRDGFVLSEGAGILVLENYDKAKARGARIYATLDGYGATGDAFHITQPDESGSGGAQAMRECLEEAGWNPEEVDYVNAHGTSTPLNDKIETGVVKQVFGDHAYKLCMSSTKSCTGHTLGAAGGIEAVATVLALHEGILPPTINYEEADEGMDLNYVPNTAIERKIKKALSNSLGFGGHNSTLAFSLPG